MSTTSLSSVTTEWTSSPTTHIQTTTHSGNETASTTEQQPDNSPPCGSWCVAGIVVALVAATIIISIIVVVLVLRRRIRLPCRRTSDTEDVEIVVPQPPPSKANILQAERKLGSLTDNPDRRYSPSPTRRPTEQNKRPEPTDNIVIDQYEYEPVDGSQYHKQKREPTSVSPKPKASTKQTDVGQPDNDRTKAGAVGHTAPTAVKQKTSGQSQYDRPMAFPKPVTTARASSTQPRIHTRIPTNDPVYGNVPDGSPQQPTSEVERKALEEEMYDRPSGNRPVQPPKPQRKPAGSKNNFGRSGNTTAITEEYYTNMSGSSGQLKTSSASGNTQEDYQEYMNREDDNEMYEPPKTADGEDDQEMYELPKTGDGEDDQEMYELPKTADGEDDQEMYELFKTGDGEDGREMYELPKTIDDTEQLVYEIPNNEPDEVIYTNDVADGNDEIYENYDASNNDVSLNTRDEEIVAVAGEKSAQYYNNENPYSNLGYVKTLKR